MPQRNEEQAADLAVGPLRQKATKHRYVLHVPGRTGGMVVAQGQGIEASSVGGPRLAEHRGGALPVAIRPIGGEGGADGYADTHHPTVYPTKLLSAARRRRRADRRRTLG